VAGPPVGVRGAPGQGPWVEYKPTVTSLVIPPLCQRRTSCASSLMIRSSGVSSFSKRFKLDFDILG